MSERTTVGSITGELTLTIGGQQVSLGTIGVPLVASPVNQHSERYAPVQIQIRADLNQVREFMEEVFKSEMADSPAPDTDLKPCPWVAVDDEDQTAIQWADSGDHVLYCASHEQARDMIDAVAGVMGWAVSDDA